MKPNPRHELVKQLLALDRDALHTATVDLEQHLGECATCTTHTADCSIKAYCAIGRGLVETKNQCEARVGVLEHQLPPDISGICRECACTDARACNPPCHWVDEAHTLCSACDERERAS